ncbi:MAG TPA: glutathione S-transferase family protein [Steroidobacteraceae bacterium]|jgi:glutathione S-transferase|nr:glutathione S-transferase family protein [Steroidobacteraceae bacterium]
MTANDRPLTLYMHPLSSYCWKALIALHELEVPFRAEMVEGRPAQNEKLRQLWPIGKMPVLQDTRRDQAVPEASIIVEYLQQYYPGPARLIPQDPDSQLEVRLWDRFFDLYVHTPLQKLVIERLRAPGQQDSTGAAEARAMLATAYDLLEDRMGSRDWVAAHSFTLAECAALPALFYCAAAQPFARSHPHVTRYFERLLTRASVQRVIEGARPYFHMFPMCEALDARFTRSAA